MNIALDDLMFQVGVLGTVRIFEKLPCVSEESQIITVVIVIMAVLKFILEQNEIPYHFNKITTSSIPLGLCFIDLVFPRLKRCRDGSPRFHGKRMWAKISKPV